MDDFDLTGNPIWKHHQNNIDEGTYVRNEDGSVSTVYTTIMGDGEYEYLIPQVWDGKILGPEEAFQRAMDSGVDWPREPAGVEGVKRLERLDELLHENMVGFDKGGLVDEDRQTQEAFEDYSSMSSIPEESIDRTPLSAEQRRDLLRDSTKFVAEMTPIVGDAMSAREVWEELQKEEPNYLLVGALAGATAVGLIPGIGDAAAQAIRTGARKGLDFARRVEVDPNALGSTGGNIRLRPESQPTPETSLTITPPAPLNSLEELLDYNNQVRQPRGMLDRDLVRPNDNILYRPDRGYRAIGPEGYQDFLESGIIRAVADNKKKLYETPYFMRGQSSSAYVRRQGEDYIVEAPLDTSWRGAGFSGDKYVGPSSNQAITRDSPIRVFRRNDDGTFEVVFDNIGDTALLPSEFNKGGVVDMDRQMSLFDMGGLTDDGAMRDPVSGNEVPPGSMASEVRDDVPAMLSEGEYIVPADVVRFFGVKFFEDLRSQAKSGLMDMERNGRIGGEPVDAPMAEGDLTPEEMAMLAEITGMAQGGMVMEDPRMAQYNMASYAASIPNQPMRGFNEGGLQPGVASMTQEDFMNQAQQGGGFQLPRSIFTPPASSTTPPPADTPVTLYGPTGTPIVLMLPKDQETYNQLLSQGYTTEPKPTPVTPPESDGGGDDGGDGGPPGGAGGGFSLSKENREALASDPLKFGTEALGVEMPFGADTRDVAGLGLIAAGPAGALAGGFVGAAMELDNIAKAKAGLAVARSQGLQDTPEFAALNAAVTAAEKDLSGPARFLSNVLGFGSGENYAASVTGMTPTPPTRAGVTPSGGGGGTPGGGGGTPRAPTTSPVPTQRPDRDSDGPAAESPADRARRGSEAVISAAEKNLASEEELADMRAEAAKAETQLADIESRASGGRNTTGRVGFEGGGLVARPSRKKPVAKKK